MSDRSDIERIKDKLDIVSVAQKYLSSMKRSGANYFALCPFHNEKTPSFSINQDLQIFKCFGCGESGDVISFIQKIEGLDFPKALQMAADQAGVVLTHNTGNSQKYEKLNKQKQRQYEANELANKFFHYMLMKHKIGARALEYCDQRKLQRKTLEKFQIGFAPDSFNSLKNFLIKKGFKQEELVEAGLLVSKNGKIYDKFRNRLIFPVYDNQSRVAGFSGRQLDKEALGPKYLNSPETLVYKKKELLYGMDKAKEKIRKENCVIMVEGNVDILSSFQAGVENIVCPLGTALTREQCQLVRRYTSNIYFAFDSDEAGLKAVLRGSKLCEEVSLDYMVIDVGRYQDSDEMIRENPQTWVDLVSKPMEFVDFLITRLEKKYDLTNSKGKRDFVKELAPYLSSVKDQILQSEYVKKVALVTSLEEEVVYSYLKGQDSPISPAQKSTSKSPDDGKRLPKFTHKHYLASLLLQNPKYVDKKEIGEIFDEWFVSLLQEMQPKGAKVNKKLIEDLGDEKSDFVKNLLMKINNIDENDLEVEIANAIRRVYKEKLGKDIKKLKLKIEKYEMVGKDTSKLIQESKQLSKKISKWA